MYIVLVMIRHNLALCLIQILITSFMFVILLLYFSCLLTNDVSNLPYNLICIDIILNEHQCFTFKKICYFKVSHVTKIWSLRLISAWKNNTNSIKTLKVCEIFDTDNIHINMHKLYSYTSISKFSVHLFHNGEGVMLCLIILDPNNVPYNHQILLLMLMKYCEM